MNQTDTRILIQDAMRASFPEVEARVAQYYAMQHYQLGWRDEQLRPANVDPGKLLRPQLTLLGCRAAGGDPAQALPLAAGIQLLHDFSLIHDDIEDHSTTRRGRPTVWTLWGMSHGINAGDGMFVVAHLAIHRLTTAGVRPEIVLEVLRRFDETILRLCEGQFLDLSFEGNLDISEADYLQMISGKTAVLLAAAAGLGAIVGGADAATAKGLYDFGLNLGLAFQMQDDVLGIWGDPAITGKPPAADLYRRKVSLPIIHALHTADQHDLLKQLYSQTEMSKSDVTQVLAILEQDEARAYTEGVAAHYHQQAMAGLDAAHGDAGALSELRTLAERLVGRQH